MQLILEAWHPEGTLRWSPRLPVALSPGPDAPLPTLPGLTALRPFLGEQGWVLRFRQEAETVTAVLCTERPPWPGQWEVISTPGLLLQRFLHECRHEGRPEADGEALIAAFGDTPLWEATRPCAALHETWRYHQELAWLDEDDPLAVWLRAGNVRQLQRQLQALSAC